ncbi:MAG: flagellar biosynthesis anti-sigma factor FlgM [Piscinibacter sp.]
MKIGNPAEKRNVVPADKTGTTGKAEAAKQAEAAAKTAGAAADPSAKVELSSAASTLAGGNTADFDAAKVERISQSIADGSYKVNAELIADKLIANAQELLGKVQR